MLTEIESLFAPRSLLPSLNTFVPHPLLVTYVTVAIVISLITFIAYALDKRRSQTDGRRISEATLHWLALFGGWPGALLGQQFFRHKTQKISFLLTFWSIVALHVGGIVAVVIFIPH